MTTRWIPLLCAAGLLAAAAQAQAQSSRPMYKCADANGKAVYTQMPCNDGKVVGEKKAKDDPKKETPPQDRARAANRAKLSPEVLKQCDALAATMKDQEAAFKALPQPTKPEDERAILQSRKEYREMKCA